MFNFHLQPINRGLLFRLQQIKESCCFPLVSFSVCGILETCRHGKMEKWRHRDIKRKMETQAIFLYLFTVCSSGKCKFVICPFVDEETDGSYPTNNYKINFLHDSQLPSADQLQTILSLCRI